MAAYDYSSLYATAVRLVIRYGRTMYKRVYTDTGFSTAYEPKTHYEDVAFVGVSTNFTKSEIDGTLILSTDKKILTYQAITTEDRIVDDGIEYSVVSTICVNPGDTKLIYKVQVRV
jgi:hypothetical protein